MSDHALVMTNPFNRSIYGNHLAVLSSKVGMTVYTTAPAWVTTAAVVGVAGAIYGTGRLAWSILDNVSYNFQEKYPNR
jgi:hypothetical protein